MLSKIETSKPNKWITLTYTGNESTRGERTLRKIDKNIKIAYKTNSKLNNIISNKIEHYKVSREKLEPEPGSYNVKFPKAQTMRLVSINKLI